MARRPPAGARVLDVEEEFAAHALVEQARLKVQAAWGQIRAKREAYRAWIAARRARARPLWRNRALRPSGMKQALRIERRAQSRVMSVIEDINDRLGQNIGGDGSVIGREEWMWEMTTDLTQLDSDVSDLREASERVQEFYRLDVSGVSAISNGR